MCVNIYIYIYIYIYYYYYYYYIKFYYTGASLADWIKDVDARVQYGFKFGKKRGFVRTGDSVIVLTGWQQGSGFTNTLRLV